MHNTTYNGARCKKYQVHKPSSFCFHVVSEFEEYYFKPFVHRGDNAVKKFLVALFKVKHKIKKIVRQNKTMILTDEDAENFNKETTCHICRKSMTNDEKCRDHCHITGKYRGAAHKSWNLGFNYKNYRIPVFFHNSKGYDTHLIMQEIALKFEDKKIECIPKTEEQFITFSIGNLRFLDSLPFMNSSLSKLVDNLANITKVNKEPKLDNFNVTKRHFQKLDNDKLKLLIRKGVYPYDYMNSFDKFKDSVLPPIDAFHSKLTNESINKKEYQHAQKVLEYF